MTACAICSGDVAVSTLCPSCRRDPANVDWVEPNSREVAVEDIGLAAELAPLRLGDLVCDSKRERVVALIEAGAVVRCVRRHRGADGRLRSYCRRRHYNPREIADMVGCHLSFVYAVADELVPDTPERELPTNSAQPGENQ